MKEQNNIPLWKYQLQSYITTGKNKKVKISLPQYSFMNVKKDGGRTK